MQVCVNPKNKAAVVCNVTKRVRCSLPSRFRRTLCNEDRATLNALTSSVSAITVSWFISWVLAAAEEAAAAATDDDDTVLSAAANDFLMLPGILDVLADL